MIKKILRRLKRLVVKYPNSPLRKGKNSYFIFIHINKTGGTSIAKATGIPHKNHLHVKEVIAEIGEQKFKKSLVFAVVRNPWDKVVSHYNYRIKTNQTTMGDTPISFKDWVKQTYGEPKNPLYYD
jgi:hypothetical protein